MWWAVCRVAVRGCESHVERHILSLRLADGQSKSVPQWGLNAPDLSGTCGNLVMPSPKTRPPSLPPSLPTP